MLFITGYCSKHVHSQTHLHDLLVAHYTGNRQSTVYNVAFAKYGNNKCAVLAAHMIEETNGLSVYYRVVQTFPSKEPNFWLRLTHRSQI